MPLNPDIAHYLREQARKPQPSTPPTLAQLRQATDIGLHALHGPAEPVARTGDFTLRARDGAPLRLRVYWPSVSDAPQPCLLYTSPSPRD